MKVETVEVKNPNADGETMVINKDKYDANKSDYELAGSKESKAPSKKDSVEAEKTEDSK